MTKRVLAFVSVCGGVGSLAYAGPTIQGFDSSGNVGSTLTAFSAPAKTIAGQYNYTNFQYSGSSPSQADLVASALNIFVVDTSEGLGFYAVLNDGVDGGASGTFDSTTTYTHTATIKIEDDDEGNNSFDVGDSGTVFTMDFAWSGSFTDGWASTLASVVGSKVTMTGVSTSGGMNKIVFHSGDGSTYETTDFGDGFGVVITAIPLPGPAALAGCGLLGIAGIRRRR